MNEVTTKSKNTEKGSLFSRLFLAFVSVILVTVILFVVGYVNWSRETKIIQDKDRLEKTAQEVVELYTDYINGEIRRSQLTNTIKRVVNVMFGRVFFIDKDGKINNLGRMGNPIHLNPKSGITAKNNTNISDELVKKLKNGEKIYTSGELLNMPGNVHMLASPLIVDDVYYGAVIIFTPKPRYLVSVRAMIAPLILVTIGAIIICILVGWMVSRSIARPIDKMSITAREIAGGDFSRRVEINSTQEIVRLAESFNYMAEQLSELDTMRSDYVANVSHELRTPLTSIRAYVEPLMDGTVTDKETKDKYLGIIKRESMRLSRLIDDLMELSGLQSGNIKIELQPVKVYNILMESWENYRLQAEEKNIELLVGAFENINDILGDEDRISQILGIFIHNAIKFTKPGGRIDLTAVEKGKYVDLMVEDNGCGMTDKDITHIWERFYKADKSRGSNGSGLGLAIAKQAAILMGGECGVRSTKDAGSTFYIRLGKTKRKDD